MELKSCKRIEVRCGRAARGVPVSWVRKVVRKTFEMEKRKNHFVGVFLAGDGEIRKINKRHLGHDYSTDVVSFSLRPDTPFEKKHEVLGDIVVSVQTARRVSRGLGISFREELARYLVHGVLHLLGYRDEPSKEKEKMHKRQEIILSHVIGNHEKEKISS